MIKFNLILNKTKGILQQIKIYLTFTIKNNKNRIIYHLILNYFQLAVLEMGLY